MKPFTIQWQQNVSEAYANMMLFGSRLVVYIARKNEFDATYKASVRLFKEGDHGQERWATVKDTEEGKGWCQTTVDRLFKEEHDAIFGEILTAIRELFDERPGETFAELGISQGIARPSGDGRAIVLIVPEIPEGVVKHLDWKKKQIRLIWRSLPSMDIE